MIRIGQKGQIQTLAIASDLFGRFLAISPDSRRLAVATWDGSMWVYDVQRKTRIKIVDGNKMITEYPLWTPDGMRVTFSAFPQAGGSNLFWQRADGSRTHEQKVALRLVA